MNCKKSQVQILDLFSRRQEDRFAHPNKLPPFLEKELKAFSCFNRHPSLIVESDLKLDGTYGSEWLVATKERLLVFESNGSDSARLRLDIALSDISFPGIDCLVGGGALQAVVGGELRDLIRYTNSRREAFEGALAYLVNPTTPGGRERYLIVNAQTRSGTGAPPEMAPQFGLLNEDHGSQVFPLTNW